MITPTVRELPLSLEPACDDTFLEPLSPRGSAPARVGRAGASPVPKPALATIVRAARAGDDAAWRQLVTRFEPRVRAVARSYRLPAADVDEVVQATWLKLFEAIAHIRQPDAIGAWLCTVTRRYALRRCQSQVREVLTDDIELETVVVGGDEPEARIFAAERREALVDAFAALPERQSRLLTVLFTQPALDYREVGELLSMPIGSIGPIRGRALARLAEHERVRAIGECG